MNKRSSYDWLQDQMFSDIIILDPDGWDRQNLKQSMEELITFEEFVERLNESTISSSKRPLNQTTEN